MFMLAFLRTAILLVIGVILFCLLVTVADMNSRTAIVCSASDPVMVCDIVNMDDIQGLAFRDAS